MISAAVIGIVTCVDVLKSLIAHIRIGIEEIVREHRTHCKGRAIPRDQATAPLAYAAPTAIKNLARNVDVTPEHQAFHFAAS